VRAVPLIVGGQSRSWVKAVSHFSRMVIRIMKHQGSRGLALHLKASQLIILRLISGKKLSQPREAGVAISLTNSGVPRWIPIIHRRGIRSGDRSVIRLYLGFCSLYRVLKFKGKLSLQTVIEPSSANPKAESSIGGFLPTFISWISAHKVKPLKGVRDREDSEYWGKPNGLRGARVFPSLAMKRIWSFTSGPNSTYSKALSIGNPWIDMVAIVSRPWLLGLLDHMSSFCGHPPLSELLPWYESVEQTGHAWSDTCWEAQTKAGMNPKWDKSLPFAGGQPQYDVGALSVIEEPGKKRIVAMVDIWTQWILYPLHRFIFDKILQKIPQDGTFDQQKPVRLLMDRAKSEGRKHFFSYDLSAATDRLPIGVQVLVLAAFTHLGYASTWREILVDRSYRSPKEYVTTFGRSVSHVKYEVGQPMGAYSSWAMLAITHHVLVQYAAWKAGHRSWFTWYAVLGDDVVIADRNVAVQYTSVMSELGVKIGFHKSIISDNGSLEFAKRFYYKGEEVLPLSLGGIAVGWLGPGFVPETILASELRHGKTISLYQVARYLGIGFKAASGAVSKQFLRMPRLLSSALLLLSRPGLPLGVRTALHWFRATSMSSGPGPRLRIASEENLFNALWTEATDSVLTPAYKRLDKIITFLLHPYLDSKRKGMSHSERVRAMDQGLGNPPPSYQEWFKMVLLSTFRRGAITSFDQAGEILREVKKVWVREESLSKALPRIEEALALLSLIPTELRLNRRPDRDVKVTDKVVERALLPRVIKRWRKSNLLIKRKV